MCKQEESKESSRDACHYLETSLDAAWAAVVVLVVSIDRRIRAAALGMIASNGQFHEGALAPTYGDSRLIL